MDVKSMTQLRLKSWFANAAPAVACQLFLSAGVASLSRGVEAMVSMRGRPLSRSLTEIMSHFEILQEACAVSESVGPSPARHGDAMFRATETAKVFYAIAAARNGRKNDRNLQAWIETAFSRIASPCCVVSTLANMSM